MIQEFTYRQLNGDAKKFFKNEWNIINKWYFEEGGI